MNKSVEDSAILEVIVVTHDDLSFGSAVGRDEVEEVAQKLKINHRFIAIPVDDKTPSDLTRNTDEEPMNEEGKLRDQFIPNIFV